MRGILSDKRGHFLSGQQTEHGPTVCCFTEMCRKARTRSEHNTRTPTVRIVTIRLMAPLNELVGPFPEDKTTSIFMTEVQTTRCHNLQDNNTPCLNVVPPF
jgi:hypothetical protein